MGKFKEIWHDGLVGWFSKSDKVLEVVRYSRYFLTKNLVTKANQAESLSHNGAKHKIFKGLMGR